MIGQELRHGLLRVARTVRGVRTPFKVTCLGDSLTSGYPHLLSFMLGKEVAAIGLPGKKSGEILDRYRGRPDVHGILAVWAGNNNFDDPEQVETDVDAIAALHGDAGKLLVLGLVNGDYPGRRRGEPGYQRIVDYNARQANKFGEHFLDIRAALIARVGGSNPSDVIPESIRLDNIHLNMWGKWLVSRIVYSRLKQLRLAT